MTPQEIFEKYRGRRAKEKEPCDVNDGPCDGIVVGYVIDGGEYTLIIAVTNGSEGSWSKKVLSNMDFIFDMKEHPGGYQYVTEDEVYIIKFGY